jgi:hypothetical protein
MLPFSSLMKYLLIKSKIEGEIVVPLGVCKLTNQKKKKKEGTCDNRSLNEL